MAIVGGLDIHRAQIFEWSDTETGQVAAQDSRGGRVSDAALA